MGTPSSWDALLVSVEVSEAGWQVRAGVGFAVWLALVLSWLLRGDGKDDRASTG